MFGTSFIKSVFILIFLISTSWSQSEIPWGVKKFAFFETKANAVSERSHDPINISHYEIPLSKLESDIADRVNPKIKDSLIFEKNGEKFVRWIIHPEDSVHHLTVKEYLESKGIAVVVKKHFIGYLQASRSLVLHDPVSKVSFSLKTSTDNTGGKWVDKKQEWSDAKEIRKIMDFVNDIYEKGPIKLAGVMMDEPFAIGIEDIDMGFVVRSLDGIDNNEFTYLPVFSAVHGEYGKKIASINGFDNPIEFLTKYLSAPLGKALAEIAATTGLTYDSPHGQNFLIELDKDLKVTGRVVLRDLGDVFFNTKIYEKTRLAMNITKPLGSKTWPPSVAFSPVHGNEVPNWMSDMEHTKVVNVMLENFRSRFGELTGVGPSLFLVPDEVDYMRSYGQLYWNSDNKDDVLSTFLSAVECFSGVKKTKEGLDCSELLAQLNIFKTKSCSNSLGNVIGL